MGHAVMRALLVLVLLGSTAAALAPAAAALPTPGLFCDRSEMATGRVFPEAMQSNDFVSYDEGVCGLKLLAEDFPDRLEYRKVADSVGWDDATGGHDTFEVFVVEVTDETSAVPFDEKQKIVFQLSIHGNEKGGREGGLRVIEDFAKGIGLLERRPELLDMLTDTVLVFAFPNPDGWVHEEAQYRTACSNYFVPVPLPTGCLDSQSFVRVNGNGVDLNREYPTLGWQNEDHTAMSEPENAGMVTFMLNYTNVVLASDIHGMLQPANAGGGVLAFDPQDPQADHVAPPDKGNFILTMLPAGRQTPEEMATTTTLAELIKGRLNSDPFFSEWQAMPRPFGAWGGDFDDWGTVWDTIFYTDSGLTSDWYAQDHGLDAPGVDFEMAYNHVTFDNYYPGLAQRMNAYHVQSVRVIVESFMDQAAAPVRPVIDAQGRDTAVLENPVVVTNTDEPNGGLTGWALENPLDDLYDVGHTTYTVRPQSYFEDLAPWVAGGRVDTLRPADLARLGEYDNLVVAGSAYGTLDAAGKDAVRAWVEAGGRLVVTDHALQLLSDWSVVDSADSETGYAGYADFPDRSHDLLTDVRGLARQLVEPVPVGFQMGEVPNWYVTGDVDVVGVLSSNDKVAVGRVPVGVGEAVFIGAFLPDPTEDFYHPYGLDAYATTYTANQILANALGWTTGVEEAPQAEVPEVTAEPAGVPALPAVLVLGAVGVVAVLRRRLRP